MLYLRLGRAADLPVKTEPLGYVLAHHADRLDQFLVVTRRDLRIRGNAAR